MDFQQEYITTLQDIRAKNEIQKKRIHELKDERPVSLVLPMLYKELKRDSLRLIVNELNKCTYLNEVIIALAAKNEKQYKEVSRFFTNLEIPHLIVWCNGNNIQEILRSLKDQGLNLLQYSGKGKDTWIALGIASLKSYAIALHDADIVTYDECIPTKLLYPIVEPSLGFHFNKGFYARVDFDDGTMYGRVFRLFIHPLLRALMDTVECGSEYLKYLDSFRYPIAGEFALTSDLAQELDLPGDWGLEIGILSEVYSNVALKRICQTDLGLYDHKHQKVGDLDEGLVKMASDIFRTMLRTLSESTQIEVSNAFLRSLQPAYQKYATDCVRQYYSLARFNNFNYSRHVEETMVDKFTKVITEAGSHFSDQPIGITIPDWQRTRAAVSDIRELLREAAIKDREKYGVN